MRDERKQLPFFILHPSSLIPYDMTLFDRWSESLDKLRSWGRYRALILPRGIDLTSNDYLDYANGRLPLATTEPLPVSGAASRLLRGQHAVWDEVESALARWHGAESVLM